MRRSCRSGWRRGRPGARTRRSRRARSSWVSRVSATNPSMLPNPSTALVTPTMSANAAMASSPVTPVGPSSAPTTTVTSAATATAARARPSACGERSMMTPNTPSAVAPSAMTSAIEPTTGAEREADERPDREEQTGAAADAPAVLAALRALRRFRHSAGVVARDRAAEQHESGGDGERENPAVRGRQGNYDGHLHRPVMLRGGMRAGRARPASAFSGWCSRTGRRTAPRPAARRWPEPPTSTVPCGLRCGRRRPRASRGGRGHRRAPGAGAAPG